MIPDLVAGAFIRDDDEGLFSRDIDGQLVRLDVPTEGDYGKMVTLQIDGQPVTVPLCEPLEDAAGNIIVDMDGRTTPRYTTILDAARKLYVKETGDEAKIPIPVLCHQAHMKPVGVCRLCVVQIYGQKRGRRAAERKLLPACHHQVKDGMEVFTMNDPGPDGDRVRGTVKVMTELLSADHLKPAILPELDKELAPFNELGQMKDRCGADASRFQLDVLSNPRPHAQPHAGRRRLDESSPVFTVDHTACILCDRCVRACDDIQSNHVIGRTGKGVNAGIGFDFNDAMGESSCVSCGECMVSCPTSAISFKPIAQIKLPAGDRSIEVLSAKELVSDPVFTGFPPKFLVWQKGLVVRRQVRAGQVLCHQGDAGNTAFLIKSGRLQISVYPKIPARRAGLLGGFLGERQKPVFQSELTAADFLVGEMACLTGSPRSATVVALEDGEVWEVRRNVIDRLMRLPSQRERFETNYRERALDLVLQGTELFKSIPQKDYQQIVDYLRKRLSFVRVSPGQILFRQGDAVDNLYLIRLGHVRVGIQRVQEEDRVMSVGPGGILGEIGLLALSAQDACKTVDEADAALEAAFYASGDDLTSAVGAGFRSATCTALGHVELGRLSRQDFLWMVREFPVLRRRIVEQSLGRLRNEDGGSTYLRQYVEQGLYEGQSILALDLDLCTRCDECTRGCVQEHGTESHGVPLTRLLRDGMRFENYVIATSCRSCVDPHCMVGCPVDSIHRGKHLQIVIEDHCIGCGLCAQNCPYGSIFMMPNHNGGNGLFGIEAPRTPLVSQPKAAACDLCDAEGTRNAPAPRCVSSCPHEAAARLTGPQLLEQVMQRREF